LVVGNQEFFRSAGWFYGLKAVRYLNPMAETEPVEVNALGYDGTKNTSRPEGAA